MTALDRLPANINPLQPVDFQFYVKKLPTVNFFVLGVNLPGISLPKVGVPSPLTEVRETGDHPEYEPFSIRFLLDENIKNWLEIHNWIRALGSPESLDEYKALADKPKTDLGEGLKTDVTVGVLSSARNLNIVFNFYDAFPVSLSGLALACDSEEPTRYVEATASFYYTLYDVSVLS